MLDDKDAQDRWLESSEEDVLGMVQSYPAEKMEIVQARTEKSDNSIGDSLDV